MKLTRIVVAALAVLALTLSAGAVAGAPDDAQAAENAPGEAGPPSDLPGLVPDFVGDIHEAIGGFLDGTVENLGKAVSDLTPGDGEKPAPASGD